MTGLSSLGGSVETIAISPFSSLPSLLHYLHDMRRILTVFNLTPFPRPASSQVMTWDEAHSLSLSLSCPPQQTTKFGGR